MTDVVSLGRFTVRNAGELQHPGCCVICQVGTRQEGYIDLDTFFDYEGRLYLCLVCLGELASTAGFLLPQETEFLRTNSERVADELTDVKEKLANAERRLASYDDVLRPLATAIYGGNADEGDESTEQPIAAVGTSAVDASKRGTTGKSVAKKSVAKPGPSDSSRSELGNSGLSI